MSKYKVHVQKLGCKEKKSQDLQLNQQPKGEEEEVSLCSEVEKLRDGWMEREGGIKWEGCAPNLEGDGDLRVRPKGRLREDTEWVRTWWVIDSKTNGSDWLCEVGWKNNISFLKVIDSWKCIYKEVLITNAWITISVWGRNKSSGHQENQFNREGMQNIFKSQSKVNFTTAVVWNSFFPTQNKRKNLYFAYRK